MLDSSPDIESDNIIKHYQRRPKQLEKLHGITVLKMNMLIGVEMGHQSQVLMTSYQKQALMTILMMTLSILTSMNVNVVISRVSVSNRAKVK